MTDKQDWKHGRFDYSKMKDEPDAVVIFDDEDEECDSIYLRYGEHLSPCRGVFRENLEHWTTVIAAWSTRAPLEDRRNNKARALPS